MHNKNTLFNNVFIRREFKSILGQKKRNFWILFFVFLCTLFSLEISRSGIKYLNYKMSDPFINWIEVQEQNGFEQFEKALSEPDVKKHFSINDVEHNNYLLDYLFTQKHAKIRFEGRTIADDSQLLTSILDEKNVIIKRDRAITSSDYGFIVTQEVMAKLGYDNVSEYPNFISYASLGDSAQIMDLSITNYNGYVEVPIPIIAVVKQLPDLLNYIAPINFIKYKYASNAPFDLSRNEKYFHHLSLVAESFDDDLKSEIYEILDKNGVAYDKDMTITTSNEFLRSSEVADILIRDTEYHNLNKAAQEICSLKSGKIERTYNYAFESQYDLETNFISIMFSSLDSISSFAEWAKKSFDVRIDMSQIEAKNNFRTFNILTTIMCFTIAIIALLLIGIFLWFLIDSHFREISKNLGTIMAFGLSNKAICEIYLRIFLKIILLSLGCVVVVLGLGEIFCDICGYTRENQYKYFSLLDLWVWITILVVPILSAVVVYFSMKSKLKATPGDLIFERKK